MPAVSIDKLKAQFNAIQRASDSPKKVYPKSLKDRVVRFAQSNPNLKLGDLANQLGISNSAIRQWCLGSQPSQATGPSTMQKLAVRSPSKSPVVRPTISTQIHEVQLHFSKGINLDTLQKLLKDLEGSRHV